MRAENPRNRRTGQPVALGLGALLVRNNRYTVILRRIREDHGRGPELVHLSIRRNDRAPIRDWRDLQRIKNELVGPQCEGVELFPAESRLVDTANQYHLWVFDDPTFRLPFGAVERLVSGSESAEAAGAVQRSFDG